jgi:hypothetical protein
VRDILGHVDICVTQNVYGKSWWRRTPFLSDQSLDLSVHRAPAGEIGINNRDYHYLSHFEIASAKRISQHLSGPE